ncbi:VOC family protein [Xenorhabdus sp. Reich]|uniref:VOC family protein n=1 Tax=Xenorhabdus littoralis TaxID=2582835 RepID=A0ABU4SJF1_9GAMM|nr:VOC family protein [Xenorhabdus sp. Reich]MDX7998784.1 VOC family protein [Xenorhabdus sp. Reich]
MIGYITLGTNDFSRAAEFYDNLLAELGAQRVMDTPNFIAWGPDFNVTNLCIIKPFDGNPATVGNGGMIALSVDSQEKVDQVYNKAIALGATDEGKPGPRGEHGFYAAYFRDLDGNKLNIFCMLQK